MFTTISDSHSSLTISVCGQNGRLSSFCLQVEHASTRVQFGSKLETYGVVQGKIARMALLQYVTEVSRDIQYVVYNTVCALTLPQPGIHVNVAS